MIIFLLFNFGNESFAQNQDQLVILDTQQGKIVIELFPIDAPEHVANFIKLSETGFYDGIVFHRIMPGFMIQAGDPNTLTEDKSTWGIGGPGYMIKGEFNDIKHNRGIVSMARAQDPDSGGSQFFIVHKDSNFLDGQYTVFGRIVTEESFETLDKIATVKTDGTIPQNPEQVQIIKTEVVSRSEFVDLMELEEPERISLSMLNATGSQSYESKALDIEFKVPEGWVIQQPEKTDENSPDFVAVGPKVGLINPVISLTISNRTGQTLDELIEVKNEFLTEAVELGNLEILSQEKLVINERDGYITNAKGFFQSNDQLYNVQFREVIMVTSDKFYTFAYSNGVDNFEEQIPRFEESINSFKILSEPVKEEISIDTSNAEGGGCLIATAAFGSELAPEIQRLRELRDNHIMKTTTGTTFMNQFNQFYYSFSPTIADIERENPLFKEIVKLAITPMISTLSILNYMSIDSEGEMLGYGLAIIFLNIGIYFVVPTIGIQRIKTKLTKRI